MCSATSWLQIPRVTIEAWLIRRALEANYSRRATTARRLQGLFKFA